MTESPSVAPGVPWTEGVLDLEDSETEISNSTHVLDIEQVFLPI